MDIDFKKLVKPYKDIALNTLCEDLKINSVYDLSTINETMPYGKGVHDCFALLKDIALKDGFEVDTCDGHCLEISYGKGKNLIYILAHQDVVPVNGVWKYPPFSATIADNRVYARGASDDKGPGISAYYALKALKDNNLIDDYRVRLVFGGDEERGSSCLTYYFETLKKEEPTYGFTPDADFPLIYGEKGITNYVYESKFKFNGIKEIDAGVVSNAVIDRAKVVVYDPLPLDTYLNEHKDIKFEKEDENTFVFIGKPAHGSTPEEGFNSGILMLGILGKVYNNPILTLLCNEYQDPFGKNMNVEYESSDMGKTTYNVGLIKYDGENFSMTVNFRYPENCNPDEVVNKVQECSPFPIKTLSNAKPLYFNPKTTPFILKLMDVYKEETGSDEKPLAIGGGTYAKEAKNCVAFGSHFKDKVDNIHAADEHIDLEDFYNSMPIYAHAIYALGKLK